MIYLASLLAGLMDVFPASARAQPPAAAPGASTYHCAARWKPGGEGGCGGMTLDSQAHRLYVARTGGVQVIDTESGALVRAIPGLDGGHGIALAPELNRGFAASGQSGTVMVFNLASLRPDCAPVAVGRQPGAVVYEPLTRHVLAFNGGSGDASVMDAATATVVATIPLGGTPESAVSDGNGTLFVSLKDKGEVLALDAQKNAVARRWPLTPGAEPTGLALDPIRHRLFVGCRDGRLLVLDAQSGQPPAELLLGKEAVACAVDPGTGCAFASCGGTLAMVREDPARPGGFRVAEMVMTPRSAGAMALDPRTHAVYLGADSSEPAPAASGKPPRPEVAPGGFVVLRYVP